MPVDDGDEGVPKYIQLARILQERIIRQEYKVEDKIPSEAELADTYHVSRVTVRQALDRLVRNNLLVRRQGLGTYVLPRKLRRDIAKVYSFTSDMERMGLKPSSSVIGLEVVDADDEVALTLRLPADNRRVTRITRVRKANESPILLETSLVPEYLCPGLVEKDLAQGSLYKILTEERRLIPHHAEETYEAIILSQGDSVLLDCPSQGAQPAFAIQRLTFLENGLPIELTRSVGRGDRLTLAINMTSSQADVERRVGF